MPTLVELAQEYSQEDRPVGVVIDDDQVLRQLIVATRFYAAYGHLNGGTQPVSVFDDITPDTEITQCEWGIIRPLFLLYVERETALQLEASRGFGVDVYGRSVSEISAEITQLESQMHYKAFCQPLVTV